MGVEVVPVDAGAYPGVPLPASSLVSVAGGPAGFQCSGLIDDAGSGEPLSCSTPIARASHVLLGQAVVVEEHMFGAAS